MVGRHADVGHDQVRLVCADRVQQCGRRADGGDHLEVEPGQQGDEALAQEDLVLGEHDPGHVRHGSSTAHERRAAGRAGQQQPPVDRGDPVGEAGQAGAPGRVGAAAAVVARPRR